MFRLMEEMFNILCIWAGGDKATVVQISIKPESKFTIARLTTKVSLQP